MNFRVRAHAPVLLEPIAFADIVINLFVFFFLSFGLFASFDEHTPGSIPIQLPSGGQPNTSAQTRPLLLDIHENGSIYLEGETLKLRNLKKQVDQKLKSTNQHALIVRADRRLLLDGFVPVLDVLRETRATRVSIKTNRDGVRA